MADCYDLPVSKLAIIFDGDTLNDRSLLVDAGIEEDDLLDVKVRSTLIHRLL